MDHCQLCYSSLIDLLPDQMQTIWSGLQIQEVTSKCNKYFSKDIIDPNTNWNLPICEECRENTKQLVQLDLKLEQVNMEIKQLIDRITTKILNERQNYQLSATNTYLSIPQTHDHLLNKEQTEFLRKPFDETFVDLNLPSSNDCLYDSLQDDDTFSKPAESVDDCLAEKVNISKKRRKIDNLPRKDENKKSNLNRGTGKSGKVTSSDLQLKSSDGFACPKCKKKFTRLNILKLHDCDSTTYECQTCGISFSSPGSLQIHSRIHTGEKPHKCETCGKCFTLPHHLRLHLRTHTEEKPYQCDICQKCFREKNYLLTHKRQHNTDENERKKYKCDICSKTFTLYKTLKYHLVRHSGDSKYKCKLCGKVCGRARELQVHELTHLGERNFKCSHCWKSFSSASCLKEHEIVHTGRKDFQCDTCGASYYTAKLLNHHNNLKHVNEGDFICDTCGRMYKTQMELNQHKRLHDKPAKSSNNSSTKRFTCVVCERSYTREHELKKHQKLVHVVTTLGSIPCDKCNKDFETAVEFHNHKRIHQTTSDSFRYKCEICDEIFRSRCDKICHFNEKHTESDFPFKCTNCGSAFLGRKDLQHHKRNDCTVKKVTTKIKKKVRTKRSEAETVNESSESDSDEKETVYSESRVSRRTNNLRRSSRVRNKNFSIDKRESESSESSSDRANLYEEIEIKTDPGIWIKEEPADFLD